MKCFASVFAPTLPESDTRKQYKQTTFTNLCKFLTTSEVKKCGGYFATKCGKSSLAFSSCNFVEMINNVCLCVFNYDQVVRGLESDFVF